MTIEKKKDLSGLVWDVWERHAAADPQREAIVVWNADGEPFRWRYGPLLDAALAVAERLLESGVGPGDVCALILRHDKEFYPVYLGAAAIGALPAVLAYPNSRLHPDKFTQGLRGMSERSGLDWILTEEGLAKTLGPLASAVGIRGVLYPYEPGFRRALSAGAAQAARRERETLTPDSPFLLQHSSGTTGLQKPIILSQRAVLGHVERYASAIALTPQDKVISWLPLYHDMGLIAAFHLPLAFGIPSVQLDPFQWIAAPGLFFDALMKEKGTAAWLPNFAYTVLAARVSAEERARLDLSSLRLLVNCSEPVRAESHARFLSAFAASGVRVETLTACYAMAEATFAVTQTAPGRPVATLEADRDALRAGTYTAAREGAVARTCVSSGRVVQDCELKIVDDAGEPLPDGVVGEAVVRSASLFDGYRNYPEKTAAALREGWYYTGDLGFIWDAELYVVGRKKDLIIVAGKNLYPEDIEDAVGRVDGVLPGRVVAFEVESREDGTGQVWVAAETERAPADWKRLVLDVKRAAMAIDVTVSKVHLVAPRALIKSSSGKLSRQANRERILSGESGPSGGM